MCAYCQSYAGETVKLLPKENAVFNVRVVENGVSGHRVPELQADNPSHQGCDMLLPMLLETDQQLLHEKGVQITSSLVQPSINGLQESC